MHSDEQPKSNTHVKDACFTIDFTLRINPNTHQRDQKKKKKKRLGETHIVSAKRWTSTSTAARLKFISLKQVLQILGVSNSYCSKVLVELHCSSKKNIQFNIFLLYLSLHKWKNLFYTVHSRERSGKPYRFLGWVRRENNLKDTTSNWKPQICCYQKPRGKKRWLCLHGILSFLATGSLPETFAPLLETLPCTYLP